MAPCKVSICIPVFNRGDFVAAAIESALQQEYCPLEILVVDNCSTDNTWEVLQSFKDSRVKLIRNDSNLGMFGNFNRCLNLASGEYIRFLCSDDLLLPETIEHEARTMQENPETVIVSTLCRHVDEKGALLRESTSMVPPGIYSGRETIWLTAWCFSNYGQNPFNFPSGLLVRRDAALKAKQFDASLHGLADVDFWLRVLEYGDACFLDHAGCTVVEHDCRASFDLFWKGLYMRGQFEVIHRRQKMYLQTTSPLGPMITRMGGRCLWYVIKSVLHGRFDSAMIHRHLLREYGISLHSATRSLLQQMAQRATRRFSKENFPIREALLHAFR